MPMIIDPIEEAEKEAARQYKFCYDRDKEVYREETGQKLSEEQYKLGYDAGISQCIATPSEKPAGSTVDESLVTPELREAILLILTKMLS